MAYSSSKWTNSVSVDYNHLTKSQAALISFSFKSYIESFKCYSNLSTISNIFYPKFLSSVLAVYLSKFKFPLELSSALVSH